MFNIPYINLDFYCMYGISLVYARLFPNHVVLVWLYASFVQTSSFKRGSVQNNVIQ